MNTKVDQRLNAIKTYFQYRSLRKAAQILKIPYQTIHRWVRWYRESGESGLMGGRYRRPWNRIDKETEERLVLLKEKNPGLTIQAARRYLKKEGFSISTNGIFKVWQRYGYTGFKRGEITSDFTESIPWTKEARQKYTIAEELFKRGEVKKAAEIVNSIPSLPKNELLQMIPKENLSLRRRIELLGGLFGKIELGSFIKEAEELFNKCLKEDLYYSALRIGILEVIALEWSAEPLRILEKINECREILKKRGKPSYLLFWPILSLSISEAIAFSMRGEIRKTAEIIKICQRRLNKKKIIPPYFSTTMAVLYSYTENYAKARLWLLRVLDQRVDEGIKDKIKGYLANIYATNGDYRQAIGLARYVHLCGWDDEPFKKACEAGLALLKGNPETARSLATQSLILSKKENIGERVFKTTLLLASSYAAIGDQKQALILLKKTIPFLRKKGLRNGVSIFSILARIKRGDNDDVLPTIKLALLLRRNKYLSAFAYARRKGILEYFYQYLFFFPEVLHNLLNKSRPVNLPRSILEYPLFNHRKYSFNIRFLGGIRIYKNQQYLRAEMPPKIGAILVHLALRANEPGKSVALFELYSNFWNNSPASARNLSRYLIKLKRTLRIHKHQIEINRYTNLLVNKSIFFTTDYQEFEQALARAKALERAGEWSFARKEYLQAFKLFRGEPFKKNFDNWSVDMRFKILSQFETEAINFAKSCIEHGNRTEAKKVLEKVKRIMPDSTESVELLRTVSSS